MYNKICLMLPTYKRLDKLKRFIDSAIDTAENKESVIFSFCVNVEDDMTRSFLAGYEKIKGIYEIIDEKTIQPNLSLYYNLIYDKTKYIDAIATEMGDDMVFLTKGWDVEILKAINESDGLSIVHCDDDYIAHEKCCVNMFVTRKLVELTKKPFMCSYYHADMVDVIWTMIATMTGIKKYLGSVKIYHDHATRQNGIKDKTFERLQPIQNEARKSNGYAVAYATIVARNLIENGVGKWNTLQ